MTPGARIALVLLRLYQLLLSPFLGGSCRFVPSCSEYAREAVATHGSVRGMMLAVHRLGRCHPFAKAGLDQVPGPGNTR